MAMSSSQQPGLRHQTEQQHLRQAGSGQRGRLRNLHRGRAVSCCRQQAVCAAVVTMSCSSRGH